MATQLPAKADKFRVVWQDDPSTTAVVGWEQVSGSSPTLHLDINDFGNNVNEYALVKRPDRVEHAKGMNNHFVRLTGLLPGTNYYFIVKDSEGKSRQMFFTTAPSSPYERISIIAGGDSRNYRDARQEANLLAGKLRPHCIMFGGDFTAGDSDIEWQEWLDDWQLIIAKDGRVTPIIPTRGNHEESNQSLLEIFDLQKPDAYFGLTIGGNLLRIYTLNSMMPVAGAQTDWLENDMRAASNITWKIAQYHHPMRPHTEKKMEKHDQAVHWAPVFYKYNMSLAIECDAHVVKATYPIRPARGPESDEGFVRDDHGGTVYVGEGCWGAPLRANNDDKSWTRASGSFNQFHWIFVDQNTIEVRFVKTDGAARVADIDPKNVFKIPVGLSVWSPPAGDVIYIGQRQNSAPGARDEILAARAGFDAGPSVGHPSTKVAAPPVDETGNWDECPMLMTDMGTGDVKIKYDIAQRCDVIIRIIDRDKHEIFSTQLSNQQPDVYLKTLQMKSMSAGRYLVIVKANGQVIQRYRVMKR